MISSTKSFKFFLIISIILIVITAMPITARGSAESAESSGGIMVTDHFGREVILEEPAQTIISLSPGITETIFALGYGDRLIGRTSFCDYPPEALQVRPVGSLTEPDIEIIVSLSPDIVIASTHFPEDVMNRLVAAGQKVAVLMGQESFQGVYDGVIRPASILVGDADAGELLISNMKVTVTRALETVAGFNENPSVYYVVGFGEGGDWTAGGDTFISEMIEMAGGKNIASDVSGWSFSLEAIIDRDPDLILVPGWAIDVFPVTPIYSDLRAVKNGSVVGIDENSIVRQGPRLADGFAELVDTIGSVN
jgi:iron complex transport system substrate-binding protein